MTTTHDLPNKLKNKTMENKSIFKVGDKVYDIRFGWGEVVILTEHELYPVEVDFNGRRESYTLLGYYDIDHLQSLLSLTEYNLQGFSQERPFDPQDCVGKWCLVWDGEAPSLQEGKNLAKIIDYDYSDCTFKDFEGMYWDNAKPLTEDQLKAFNLTND